MRLIVLNCSFVLAMCSNQHRYFSKNPAQRFFVINQHITCRRAHKHFHPTHSSRINFSKFVEIIIGGSHIERKVCECLVGAHQIFVFERFYSRCKRHSIGHIHKRSYTTSHSSPRLGIYIPFMRKTRIAKMYLIINNTRNKNFSTGINYLCIFRSLILIITFSNTYNQFIFNQNRAGVSPSVINYCCVFYE